MNKTKNATVVTNLLLETSLKHGEEDLVFLMMNDSTAFLSRYLYTPSLMDHPVRRQVM